MDASDPDDKIPVPANAFKYDDSVNCNKDLALLLRVMMFWGLFDIPEHVFHYCHRNHCAYWEHCFDENVLVTSMLKPLFMEAFGDHHQLGAAHPLLFALLRNRLDMIKYLVHSGQYRLIGDATAVSAGRGRLDYLTMLHENGFRWSALACTEAAAGGHLDCMIYAHNNGCPWDVNTLVAAAGSGKLECVAYYVDSTQRKSWSCDACKAAAKSGHLHVLSYLHDNGCPWDVETCIAAAQGGHFSCVKYAHDHGCPLNMFVCSIAAGRGDLKILQFAHMNGCPWDEVTCVEEALRGGHLLCLQYLHDNGCALYGRFCLEAAELGHADCLQYGYTKGCPMNSDACSVAAAGRGNLKCLEFIYASPAFIKWDEQVTLAAGKGGHMHCLHFALDRGCALHPSALDSLELDLAFYPAVSRAVHAKWSDYFDSMHDLEEHSEVLTTAVRNGRVLDLQYILERGCFCGEDLVLLAAQCGRYACVVYLVECQLRYMNEDGSVFVAALQSGDLRCLQYLIDQGCPYTNNANLGFELIGDKIASAEYDSKLQSCLELACEKGWLPVPDLLQQIRSHELRICWDWLHDNGAMEAPRTSTRQPLLPKGFQPDIAMCEEDFLFACRTGDVDALHCAHERGAVFTSTCMAAAAQSGHIGCVRFLHQLGCAWDKSAADGAARFDHVGILRYALHHGCPYGAGLVELAAASGSIACLMFLMEESGCNYPLKNGPVFKAAFVHARFDCVAYLIQYGYPFRNFSFSGTLGNCELPHYVIDEELLSCLICAMDRGWKCNKALFDLVLLLGYQQCVAYIVTRDLKRTAITDYHECMRYSLGTCCPEYNVICPFSGTLGCGRCLRDYTMDSQRAWLSASIAGCLDCMSILAEQSVPCDASVSAAAAARGQLLSVKFLHEHMYPWDEGTIKAAVLHGHPAILEYALVLHCPYSVNIMQLAAGASRNSIACITCIYQLCGLLGDCSIMMGNAMMRADVACVEYLVSNMCIRGSGVYTVAFMSSNARIPRTKDAQLWMCIHLALRHGWLLSVDLVEFVWLNNFNLCKEYLVQACADNPLVQAVLLFEPKFTAPVTRHPPFSG